MLAFLRSNSDPHSDFPDWKFSDHAISAMRSAVEEAHRFHHEWLGSEHLLLGFYRIAKSDAAEVLGQFSIAFESLNAAIESIHGICPVMITKPHLDRTTEHRNVIRHSIYEAHALGHLEIGTGHLLLGMLRDRCDAFEYLARFQVATSELELQIVQRMNSTEKRR